MPPVPVRSTMHHPRIRGRGFAGARLDTNQPHQLRRRVGVGAQKNTAKRAAAELLLNAQILVHRARRVDMRGQPIEDRTAVKIGGAKECADGRHVVAGHEAGEALGLAGIEQDTHAVRPTRRPRRPGSAALGGRVRARPPRARARRPGSVGEKVGPGMAALDIANERTHGDTRPREAGFATEPV